MKLSHASATCAFVFLGDDPEVAERGWAVKIRTNGEGRCRRAIKLSYASATCALAFLGGDPQVAERAVKIRTNGWGRRHHAMKPSHALATCAGDEPEVGGKGMGTQDQDERSGAPSPHNEA